MKLLNKSFFLEDLYKYSICPSFYQKDKDELWMLLYNDFKDKGNCVFYRAKDICIPEEQTYFVFQNNSYSNYWILVHVDKIKLNVTLSPWYCNGIITGRLDNSVSIALVKQLCEVVPINVAFVTMEEVCHSYMQVKDFVNRNKEKVLNFIDLDIDVYHEEFFNLKGSEITIRDGDTNFLFDEELVLKLRDICNRFSLNWVDKKTWVVVQAGLISGFLKEKAAYIGIPLYNYHTTQEKVYWDSLQTAFDLLLNLFKEEFNKKKDKVTYFKRTLL